jgi:hypothetical protein
MALPFRPARLSDRGADKSPRSVARTFQGTRTVLQQEFETILKVIRAALERRLACVSGLLSHGRFQ